MKIAISFSFFVLIVCLILILFKSGAKFRIPLFVWYLFAIVWLSYLNAICSISHKSSSFRKLQDLSSVIIDQASQDWSKGPG